MQDRGVLLEAVVRVYDDVGGVGDIPVHGGATPADQFEGDVAGGLVDELGEDAGAVRSSGTQCRC